MILLSRFCPNFCHNDLGITLNDLEISGQHFPQAALVETYKTKQISSKSDSPFSFCPCRVAYTACSGATANESIKWIVQLLHGIKALRTVKWERRVLSINTRKSRASYLRYMLRQDMPTTPSTISRPVMMMMMMMKDERQRRCSRHTRHTVKV